MEGLATASPGQWARATQVAAVRAVALGYGHAGGGTAAEVTEPNKAKHRRGGSWHLLPAPEAAAGRANVGGSGMVEVEA